MKLVIMIKMPMTVNDVKNSVANSQCGKLIIFLPFRFYAKPIFGDFRNSKTTVLRIVEAHNFDFDEILQIFLTWNF